MSDIVETAPRAVPRDRSVEARRAVRQVKASRERRIIASLNRGVSVAVIAECEDVGEKRMRVLVRDILARRMPEPPAQFLAMQVSRLVEALLVSFGAMSGSNLQAVDRVVKIVRELDRYRGFAAAGRRGLPVAPEAPEEIAPWLEAYIAKRSRPQMAPQRLEKIESAPGNGMASEAPDPQDMVQSATAPRRLSPPPAKLLARSRRLRPARKWQRKSSRTLNPRPEMVWLRKARDPKIWRRRANHSSAQPLQTRTAPDG
jgi:hypothetical protein